MQRGRRRAFARGVRQMSSVLLVLLSLPVSIVAGACQQATLLNLPRDPRDRRFVVDDDGVRGALADGSVEDVYRRAALAGCTRAGAIVTCKSLEREADRVQAARFTVGHDPDGHVVVIVIDGGADDPQGLRRWLYTLCGGEQQDPTPPAPPLLP
jgi:hypothetical protein